MTQQQPTTSPDSIWEDFRNEVEAEYDQTSRSLKEVKLMLEQSQIELNKLIQRNAAITAHLQQVQAQFDTIPRPDIRNAYNAALDAQQRMLVMRSQLDKLQNDNDTLSHHLAFLDKVRGFIAQGAPQEVKTNGKSQSSGSSTLEMLVKAQEAERQRLSRQMHDGPAQALSNFIVQTEIANRLLDIDSARAKVELDNLKNSAMSSFKEVRSFIFELRPMMLDDLGLYPTARRYVESMKEQTGVDISLNLKGSERRLESYLEVMIFRALQELVGNAYRHNQDSPVKLQITVNMLMDENVTRVSVSDNGKGFDPAILEQKDGVGLRLIRERVELLGGSLDVDSDVGKGSRISFQVPTIEASNA